MNTFFIKERTDLKQIQILDFLFDVFLPPSVKTAWIKLI